MDKRNQKPLPGEREDLGWDAFVGPTHLIPDDRAVPSHLVPMLAATHGIRLAAEMNMRLLESFTRGR